MKGCADCKRRKCRPEFMERMKFVAEEKVRLHQLVSGLASADMLNDYAEPIAPHLGADACSELAKGKGLGGDADGGVGGRGRPVVGGTSSPFASKKKGFMGRFSRANSSTTIVGLGRDRPTKSNGLAPAEGSPSVSDPGQEDLSSEDTTSAVNDSPCDLDDDDGDNIGNYEDGEDDELKRLGKVVEEGDGDGDGDRDRENGDDTGVDSEFQSSPMTSRRHKSKNAENEGEKGDYPVGSDGKKRSPAPHSRKKKGKSPAGRELIVE